MFINGQEYAYADLQFSFLANFNVAGVNAITIASSQAKANVNGTGTEPVARTRGVKSYDGSTITVQPKEFFRMIEANGFRELTAIPPFNLTVSFANGADPVKTIILPYTEFTDSGFSATRGDTEIEIPLGIIHGPPIHQ